MTPVSAPPATQARLLDLAALDADLGRIAAHRARLTAAGDLAAAQAERTALRRAAADQRGALEDLQRELGRVESDVAVVEQRLERDRTRLATTSSPKDAQSFEAEITALLRRRATLEDAELELMERVESAEEGAALARTAVEEADARVAALQADRDDALAGLDAQQAEVERRRAGLVSELPADLVALYDRQRARYGIGAALLRRRISTATGVELTGADLAMVRSAAPDAVVLDPDGGSILIRTEESGL